MATNSTTVETIPDADRGRRPDIEKELTEKYHVQWTYHPAQKVSVFDLNKSQHNQARFEAIDQKTVDLYATAVKRGDVFPAVIAYRPGPRQRLVIIDGNHRLSAHVAADGLIDVYEVDRDTDPRVIALMTFGFNTRHGKPTSEAERISQALYLVDNGASLEKAAAEVNIATKLLRKALNGSKADRRADEVGLRRNEWDTLTGTVRQRLVNISTDEGFHDAAKLAYDAKMDANETFDLVALLNASKSGTKQREIVKAHRTMWADRIQGGGLLKTAGRGKGMSPKARVGMLVGQSLALPEDDKLIVDAYAAPERKDAAKRMKEAGDRLLRLSALLDK